MPLLSPLFFLPIFGQPLGLRSFGLDPTGSYVDVETVGLFIFCVTCGGEQRGPGVEEDGEPDLAAVSMSLTS